MIQNQALLKDVTVFSHLLNIPSKQKHSINSRDGTQVRLTTTLLMSILTESDAAVGKQILDTFSQIIYNLLVRLKESNSIMEDLDMLIPKFSSENRNKPFSAGRSTVQAHLPQLSKAQIDERAEEDYCKCIRKLEDNGAKSPKAILAIDMSHEASKSKFKNNQHSPIRIGQRKVWEMGFNYSSVYDSTHQLFLGIMHHNKHKTKRSRRAYQPWIEEIQRKIAIMESQGIEVALVEADRGYFDIELFATSHLGLLRPHDLGGGFVRAIVPRKFNKGKNERKWEFLMDPTSKQVTKKEMALNFYSPYGLIDKCEEAALPRKDSLYQIPVAQVVVVDEYNNKKNRSFEMLREEAIILMEKNKKARELLRDTESQLLNFQRKNRLKQRLPKYYKGQSRSKFKYYKEKELYLKCLRLKKRIDKYKRRKESIVNSMGFFYISLRLNEDPERYSNMFLNFARDYHERWGIENGFRDIKQSFKIRSRSQKSTRRQYFFCLGFVLYNHWQVFRRLDMLRQERNRIYNIVPWDSRRPHVRKKLERYIHTNWTAKSYLVGLVGLSLSLCIEKVF